MLASRGLGFGAACAGLLTLLVTTTTVVAAGGYGGGPGPIAVSPYSGFNPVLARAPYVTDLTQTSAVVTWATNPDIHGVLEYGPLGDCTATSIPVGTGMVTQIRVSPNPTTIYPVRYDYQSSVLITGLSPSTSYCYEVFGTGTSAVDLLPNSQPFQTFTTLDPEDTGSTAPLTFAVLGDFGETANRGPASDPVANTPTSVNSNQAAIDALIGSSGARFVVSVGDIAYADGGNYNYGDLEQNGANLGGPGLTEMSNIFGPSYWPLTGGLPLFTAGGNHGTNSTLLTTWPESNAAAASGGTYAMQQYSTVDSIRPASYPNDWYAFSSGNVRFYLLDGSWNEGNVGTAMGSACPYTAGTATCKAYQVDVDAHFQPGAPEYQWLVNDLQSHPGGIKLAFFHYPLRSDNATQDSDVYLQQAVEPLLAQYGVQVAFSGHAHDYERNTAPGAGTIVSYVTGGGGGAISTVAGKGCSSWDAFAIGWTYGSGTGQKCGAAPAPASDAQVYHFLKVTIAGRSITVTPINAAGQPFDQQTYSLATPTPTAPFNVVAAALDATTIGLSWNPSTETGGTIASYVIQRNQAALTTVSGAATSFTDSGAQPGTTYTYSVTALDAAGTTSSAGVSGSVTTPLMSTGFESDNMTGWAPITGQIAVQSAVVHSGSYAVSVSSSGAQAFALHNLPASSPVIDAQASVYVSSQSTAATLFGLRTSSSQLVQVYVNATGTIKVLNNVTKASYLGNVTIGAGAWHEVRLASDETQGTIQVWVDGSPVQFASPSGPTTVLSGQNLGSVPISNVQLGDDSTGRVYSWYADDIVVSTVPPGQ